MNIQILISGEAKIIEIFPSVIHKSHCELSDFPQNDFNLDVDPIFHTLKLVVSLDLIKEEYEYIEEELLEKYWIDKERNLLIIAKLRMTEFPNTWREIMGDSWSYWLDAVDGDHHVIGCRADEIIERELYDEPFDNGSLFYIQDLDVHESFKGEDLDVQLLRYTFQSFLHNATGMIFVIPQKVDKGNPRNDINSSIKIIKDAEMIKQYEKCGFVRTFNSEIQDMIMEIEVHKLQDF